MLKRSDNYEFVPPDGGWGYVIALAFSTCIIAIVVPYTVFGAVFGPFLATLGDETSATTLITGVFNTFSFLAGLPVNHLLQKYTYRKVGLIGAVIYSTTSFFNIFSMSVEYMVVMYSIAGFGFGLMFPSALAAFNEYFVLKQNSVMSAAQTLIGIVSIVWPIFTNKLMQEYGFRGTTAIFSAIGLNGFAAMLTLQPVSWHYKKKTVSGERIINVSKNTESNPLMKDDQTDWASTKADDISSIEHEEHKDRKTLAEKLDLALFKDLVYINIAVGVSLAFTSDIVFLSIIPALLNSYGFEKQKALLLTIYFAADLVGRIFLSIITAMYQIRSRTIVFVGAVISTVFRIAFTFNSSFWWIVSVLSALGLIRCCIQVPFPLVFAEKYGPRFPTAFSLFMVVCGLINLATGFLSGYIKDATGIDTMVVHLLTSMYAFCALTWFIEPFILKMRQRNVNELK